MAIAHVQSKSGSGASTTPQVTLDAAPTNGNNLIAMVSVQGTRTLTVNSGAGWAKLTEVGSGDTGGLYWKRVGAGESATQQPTTSDSASANWTICMCEYSGITASSPVEAETGNADNDATKTTTGTANPTDSVARLIIGGAFSTSTGSFSAQKVNGSTTSVNERGDQGAGSGSNQTSCTLFDKIESSTVSGNYTTEAVSTNNNSGAAFIAIFIPAAGTQFDQSVSGGVTPAGTVTKQDSKPISGALSSIVGTLTKQDNKTVSGAISSIVGTLSKSTSKAFAGTITSAGALTREAQKILAGTFSSAGALSTNRGYTRSFDGSITPSGSIARDVSKALAGILAPTGDLSKIPGKLFSGSLTPAGALDSVRLFVKSVGGTLAAAGALVRDTTKSFTGSITPSGATSKESTRTIGGSLSSSGSISKQTNKVTAGTITSSGTVSKSPAKAFGGTVNPSGSITKQAQKALAGVITSAGEISRAISKALAGTVTSNGTVNRLIAKTLAGSLSLAGSLVSSIASLAQPSARIFHPRRSSISTGREKGITASRSDIEPAGRKNVDVTRDNLESDAHRGDK